MRKGADKLLSGSGKFIDALLEADYQKYMVRKTKEGKVIRERLEWKEVRDYFLNDSPLARGNVFNKKADLDGWYPYNEVVLANGKRVDSYDPLKGEIVSRKATSLDDIEFETFERYLKELIHKYPPGMAINSPKYKELLKGQKLKGKQILELPESNKGFGDLKVYIDLAKNKYDIEIRFRPE